ncbi:MAG: septum formation initiator family protein [bacterium]
MSKRDHPDPSRKRESTSSAKKSIGRGLLLGAVLLLVYVFLLGDYGAYRIWKQKREIAQMEQAIEALHLRQQELKEEADLLKNDPEYIEKIAREEYGMIKRGEIIYRMVPSLQGEKWKKGEGKDGSSGEERQGNL